MSLCASCLEVGSFSQAKATGQLTKLGKFDAYITGDEKSDKAVIIVPDVWGYSFNNVHVVADKFASHIGARVYIPDFHNNEDFNKQRLASPDPANFKPAVGDFLAKYHPRDAAWPSVREAVDEIRKVQKPKKVGAVGYCWGAPSILHLGSAAAGASKVDAVAFAHPSLTETSDFEALQVPGLFVLAEHDQIFTPEKKEAAQEATKKFAKQGGPLATWVWYPGVTHGFAIRGDESDAYTAQAMGAAANQVASFFGAQLA
ncbi:alpha/beta-hydrolase [Ceraceosorus guamensis]|uniref:Alpha/beta-hydrolase n=1 Tax=Ceraceosorus guamensis TaxID=1522189 RepID=A0A316W1L2_9BASI|nr:alpha/beta-hydrolase [Ceraceosorus guamensis]PWN43787.1 alpha/beta-hydrolase [Ceraceosorus guamensis]